MPTAATTSSSSSSGINKFNFHDLISAGGVPTSTRFVGKMSKAVGKANAEQHSGRGYDGLEKCGNDTKCILLINCLHRTAASKRSSWRSAAQHSKDGSERSSTISGNPMLRRMASISTAAAAAGNTSSPSSSSIGGGGWKKASSSAAQQQQQQQQSNNAFSVKQRLSRKSKPKGE